MSLLKIIIVVCAENFLLICVIKLKMQKTFLFE